MLVAIGVAGKDAVVAFNLSLENFSLDSWYYSFNPCRLLKFVACDVFHTQTCDVVSEKSSFKNKLCSAFAKC